MEINVHRAYGQISWHVTENACHDNHVSMLRCIKYNIILCNTTCIDWSDDDDFVVPCSLIELYVACQKHENTSECTNRASYPSMSWFVSFRLCLALPYRVISYHASVVTPWRHASWVRHPILTLRSVSINSVLLLFRASLLSRFA